LLQKKSKGSGEAWSDRENDRPTT